MALESGTYISDLVATNPTSTDLQQQGDDHLRLLKAVVRATFPNADKAFYFPAASAKTGNYTVVTADQNSIITVDATAGAFNLTLPILTAGAEGWSVVVVKLEATANAVSLVGTINGRTDLVLQGKYSAALIWWTGTAWLCTLVPTTVQIVTHAASATLSIVENKCLTIVDTTSASVTLTLPDPTTCKGFEYSIYKSVAANSVIVSGSISGLASVTWTARYGVVDLISNGVIWVAKSAEILSYTRVNTWTEKQTFVKSVVRTSQALTDASTTSINADLGAIALWTIGGNRTLAAITNLSNGQEVTLDVVQDGTGNRTISWDASYNFNGSVDLQPAATAGAMTRFRIANNNGTVTVEKLWHSTFKETRWYTEHDLGAASSSGQATVTHNLGKVPSNVVMWLECVTTTLGYAVGARVMVTGGYNYGANRGAIIAVTATTVDIRKGTDQIYLLNTSGIFSATDLAKWKYILQIYE